MRRGARRQDQLARADGRDGRSRRRRGRSRGARGRARPPVRRARPGRASIVILVSTPKPAATGNTARRARSGQRALPRQRLAHPLAGAELDQRPRDRLRDAEPAADPARERRDRDVRPVACSGLLQALDERPEIAAEVGVAEQERPGRALALGEGERLPLAAAWQPDDPRTGRLRPERRWRRASRRRRQRPRAPGNASRSAATVPPIRSSSSRAATRTLRRSVTLRAGSVAAEAPGAPRPRRPRRSRSYPAARRRAGIPAQPGPAPCRCGRRSTGRAGGRRARALARASLFSTPTAGSRAAARPL